MAWPRIERLSQFRLTRALVMLLPTPPLLQATLAGATLPPVIAGVTWGVVIAACLVAAAIDVRSRRIPNVLTMPLAATGLLWSLAIGGTGGLGDGLAGMAVAGLPFVVLWLVGGGGAGDAKMMLGIGAWLGLSNAVPALLGVALAGGLVSLVYAAARQRMGATLLTAFYMLLCLPFVLLGPGRLQDRQAIVPPGHDGPVKAPYGLAILIGTCGAAAWVLVWNH